VLQKRPHIKLLFNQPILQLFQVKLVPKSKLLEIILPARFTGWMPFLSPNHERQSTDPRCYKVKTKTKTETDSTLLVQISVQNFNSIYPQKKIKQSQPYLTNKISTNFASGYLLIRVWNQRTNSSSPTD